jgi:hypothetical protein
VSQRELIQEYVLEPGTGKAIELRRGQVLRVEQVVGDQCAELNCFNLRDSREHFDAARTRRMHGDNPSTGDFLWSARPWGRPMAAIVADTPGTNDVSYPHCSAFLFEHAGASECGPSCSDMQAEAQREYGLTPDYVHHSFNLFLHTGVDACGHPRIGPNVARRGDYVEVLALIDMLAVPNVCGAGAMAASGYEPTPLRLAVYESAPGEVDAFEGRRELRPWHPQGGAENFDELEPVEEWALARDPGYVADFAEVPIAVEDVEVELEESDTALLDALLASGDAGRTRADALRHAFFNWWVNDRAADAHRIEREVVA